jgi:hypothetical protein
MSWVMPEVVVQKVLDLGIKKLRANKAEFYDVFAQFTQDELSDDYGPKYLDEIWKWFSTTKIPVVKAWALNAQIIPCFSVHLVNETEDESKAAVGDIFGTTDEDGEIGTGVFTVMVDIGVHANKVGDHVLWMYYIASYVLFKYKLTAERFGLRMHTFSASDYNKDAGKMTENIWTRWIRFKCTTENFWTNKEGFVEIDEVNTDVTADPNGGPPDQPYDVAVSEDVDITEVNTNANDGLIASRAGDDDDSEDVII